MQNNNSNIGYTSKYDEMLKQYNLDITDEEVKAAVKKIIEARISTNSSNVWKSRVFLCFTKLIADSLEIDGVDITNVTGNFPSSQTFLEVKTIETALAIKDGATQIDIVLPVGKFLSGDYEDVYDQISELKQTCGDVPMKVILETGDLKNARNIKAAALLSMFAGANYIKTSTGKEKISATPEAVYIMCTAIKEFYDRTGVQVGLKPAGGINTVMDAVIFYTIYKEVLGEKWLTNYWFRLGTSRLTNLLLSDIEGKEVKFF